jgi:hypothetical protein
MEQRPLGRQGLTASAQGLGCIWDEAPSGYVGRPLVAVGPAAVFVAADMS